MPLAALARPAAARRAAPRGPGGRGRDPDRRRTGGAGAAARTPTGGGLVAPQILIGAGLALALGRAHRGRAGRPLAARDPRRLDDRVAPRRRLHRPADPDADLHRRPDGSAERRRGVGHPDHPRLALRLTDKVDLGTRLVEQIEAAPVTKPPDLRSLRLSRRSAIRPDRRRRVQDQIDRAVTHAFVAVPRRRADGAGGADPAVAGGGLEL